MMIVSGGWLRRLRLISQTDARCASPHNTVVQVADKHSAAFVYSAMQMHSTSTDINVTVRFMLIIIPGNQLPFSRAM